METKTLSLYCAGKFNDEFMPINIFLLEKEGFKITYNWSLNKDLSKSQSAFNDIEGVKKCDILIVFMNDKQYEYRGTFCEIGCALGLNKKIIIINNNKESYCTTLCFYHHHSIIHVNDINKAIRILNLIEKNIQNKEIKRKMLILGPGRHGKDSFTEILTSKLKNYKFSSSSEFVNNLIIFDILKDKYNYKTKEECFLDRHNHREEWYNIICDYNKEDKSKLTREIFKENDIYVGIRDLLEFKASYHLFEIIFWIDSSERLFGKNIPFDNTLKIEMSESDIVIDNNGTLEDLEKKINDLIIFLSL